MFKWALSIVAIILVAGGIFFFISKPAGQNYDGPKQAIRIGNVGEYSILNIIAEKKGFFDKHGLDATVTEYDSGATSMKAMLEGKEDVIVAADFLGTLNIFSSPHIRIISGVSRQKSFELVARRDHEIDIPSDLRGKKIGVTKNSHGEFFLGTFLNFNDLELTDVTIVNLPPGEIVKGIENGDIDAGVTFGPHVFKLKKILGDAAYTTTVQGNQNAAALLYSTEAHITSQPEALRRYFQALHEAEVVVKSDPEESKRILAEYMKYDPEYVNYIWEHINFDLSLNQDILLAMENQARWASSHGLTSTTTIPNYLHHIYFDALDAVKPYADTIIH